MAAPAIKIEGVTMGVSPGAPEPYDGYPRWSGEPFESISKSKGDTPEGMTVIITIPDPEDPENPAAAEVLSGDWYTEWVANANWKKDPVETVIMSKVTLTFDDGTFEGMSQRTIKGSPFDFSSYFEDSMVLHGTEDFQGQTLKLSYAGRPIEDPMIADGYIIMPK